MSTLITKRWSSAVGAIEIDWDRGKRPQGPHSTIKNGNNVFTNDATSIHGNNVIINEVTSVTVSHAWFDESNGTLEHSLLRVHQSGKDARGRTIADWGGNFDSMSKEWTSLLFTGALNPLDGPIRIIFNNFITGPVVRGVGAQIQIHPGSRADGVFTAKIRAFGLKGKREKLGEFLVKDCPSNSNGDDSAQFIGIEGPGIACVEFYAGNPDKDEFYPEGFAINRLSVLV